MKLLKLGGLILPLLFTCQANASEESEALEYALKAGAKQFGIEAALTRLVEKQIPRKYIKMAEQVAPAIQIISTGRITLKWEI